MTMYKLNYLLNKWMRDHGIENIPVMFGPENYYAPDYGAVFVTLVPEEERTIKEFAQFLYEFGCNVQCLDNTYAMLHEIGHAFTYESIDTQERLEANLIEYSLDIDNVKYWLTPREFEANVWAINFINAHPDWAMELDAIFKAFLSQPDIFDTRAKRMVYADYVESLGNNVADNPYDYIDAALTKGYVYA